MGIAAPLWTALLTGMTVPTQAQENAPVTLANGLRVLSRERRATPLVAIDLWVRAGAREEAPDEAGSAHFLEHTLFKSTPTRRAGQADWDIENLGGTLNASTGPDYAHFYVTVATPNVSRALSILADVIQNALLPDAQVERERSVILDELAEHVADPAARVVDLLYAGAFPSRLYGRSPGGSPDAIRLRGRDTLAAFYRRTYQPTRCTLVLVGDLSAAQARQWAQETFGVWQPPARPQSNLPQPRISTRPDAPVPADAMVPAPSGTTDAVENPKPKTQNQDSPVRHQPVYAATPEAAVAAPVPLLPAQHITLAVPASRPALGVGLPAPPASAVRMTAAAMLVGEILGGLGRGGRLDVSALAHTDAQARFTPRHDDSLWIVTASVPRDSSGDRTNNTGTASKRRALVTGQAESNTAADTTQHTQEEQTRRLEAVLRNILARLGSSPPAPLEMQSAQRRLMARMDAETETNEGLAAAVGYADITGGDTPQALRQRIQQTTPADVRQFVTRYLLSQTGVTVILQTAAAGAGPGQ